jgi:hypothetical protein
MFSPSIQELAMKQRRVFVKTLSVCLIVVLATACSWLCAKVPSAGAELVVPRETKVVLLQPIDATVDSARLGPLRQQIVRLRQQYEFISRQFVVLGESMTAKVAAAGPNLDLESKQGRSANALDELAGRLGADWVVSIVVMEIAADESDSLSGAHSTLLVRVRDARRHVWLTDRTHIGRSKGAGSPPELFLESLDTATEEALAPVLFACPQVVTVSRDGSIVDYLAGQAAPFVGDPGTTFFGLKARPANKP